MRVMGTLENKENMKLERIEIKNFRSISFQKISIEKIAGKECLILLGKNEAGKSNILSAISLLDSTEKVDYSVDCNKKAREENEDITVSYFFSLNEQESLQLIGTLNIPSSLVSSIKINIVERIVEIAASDRADYYNITLQPIQNLNHYVTEGETTIKPVGEVYKGEEKLTEENISALLGANYKLLTQSRLEDIVSQLLDEALEQSRPETILWKSSNEYLINDPVGLNAFKENFSLSPPLKNIFRLSGISEDKIKARIELITSDRNKRIELEEELSENITKYLNKAWPELKINVHIRIEESLSCAVSVADKSNTKPKFMMSQRSDGFKQFVSILLHISAENQTQDLENKIVLLDEPEVHLHPSGTKYLREELLKIAENNVVVVATHSIFMVDKKNIDRHYHISKSEDSLTNLEKIDKDNPLQEEVIYEAFGTSIYEILKENVLVFEGKSDKDYFDFFTKKFKTELNPLDFYTIPATGVEKVPNYIKFLKDGLIKGFAIVDSDKAGVKVKTQILKDDIDFNKRIFEINDIDDQKIEATLEDLLPSEILMKYFKEWYKFDFALVSKQPIEEQMISKLKEGSKFVNDQEFKQFRRNMHVHLLAGLVKKTITKEKIKQDFPKYFKFLTKLHTRLKK